MSARYYVDYEAIKNDEGEDRIQFYLYEYGEDD